MAKTEPGKLRTIVLVALPLPVIAVLISILSLCYTAWVDYSQDTRLTAREIRLGLARFATDSNRLFALVFNTQTESLSEFELVYTSIIREIEGVSTKPKDYYELRRFVQSGIYSSYWYKRQQSIRDSLQSVSYRDRLTCLTILHRLATRQIGVIEYPISTGGFWKIFESDLHTELVEECAKSGQKNTNDMMKCIDHNVKTIIEIMEFLYEYSFEKPTGLHESLKFLDRLGTSLRNLSSELNDFVQELTTCLRQLPDRDLIEVSMLDASPGWSSEGNQDDLPSDLRLLGKEIRTTLDKLRKGSGAFRKKCGNIGQDICRLLGQITPPEREVDQ